MRESMDGISILWRPNSIYSDQTCRSSVGGYCDHQENRKSVIGRDHLRVPSGVPLPASGLSAASGLHTSQRAEGASLERLGRDRTQWCYCPLSQSSEPVSPTTERRRSFRNLRKRRVFLESGPTPRVFFPKLRTTKGTDRRLALDLS